MFSLRFSDDGGAIRFTSTHMSTARREATRLAVDTQRPVLIMRGDRPSLVIRPDGGAQPPAGARTDCKAAPGAPPCFCVNCRAARRR